MGNTVFGGPSTPTGSDTDKKHPRDSSKKHRDEYRPNDNDDGEPNRWIQDFDGRRKRIYYWNPALKEISWKLPTGSSSSSSSNSNRGGIHGPALEQLLPSDSEWQVAYDRTNQRPYFYNPRTQQVRWVLGGERGSHPPSSESSGQAPWHIIVEHKGQRGLVQVPALTSSLSTVRQQLFLQLDEDMQPPKVILQDQCHDQQDWLFQLESNDVLISKMQEQDVQLLQTLLKRYDPLIVKIHSKGDSNNQRVGQGSPEQEVAATKNIHSTKVAGEEDASQNEWENLDTDSLNVTNGTPTASDGTTGDTTNRTLSIPPLQEGGSHDSVSPPPLAATTTASTSTAPILDGPLTKSTTTPLPSPTLPPPTTTKGTASPSAVAPGKEVSVTKRPRTPLLSVPPLDHNVGATGEHGNKATPKPTVSPLTVPPVLTTIGGTTPRPLPPPLPPTIKPRSIPTPPPPPTRRSTRQSVGGSSSSSSSSNGNYHISTTSSGGGTSRSKFQLVA